jgi:hypothetical protein
MESAADPQDLSTNRPGAAAHQRASSLRDAAPVRTLLARVLRVSTEERAFRIGAEGEEDVGRRLARLGAEWRAIHAVPIGGADSDIDHVVVGPAGVFTINTKHHPNGSIWVAERTFMLNGHRVPYLPKSVAEAKRAARLLSAAVGRDVNVRPIIVIVGAARFTMRSEPPDVRVISGGELATWLHAQPVTMDSSDVETVFLAARRASSWHPA